MIRFWCFPIFLAFGLMMTLSLKNCLAAGHIETLASVLELPNQTTTELRKINGDDKCSDFLTLDTYGAFENYRNEKKIGWKLAMDINRPSFFSGYDFFDLFEHVLETQDHIDQHLYFKVVAKNNYFPKEKKVVLIIKTEFKTGRSYNYFFHGVKEITLQQIEISKTPKNIYQLLVYFSSNSMNNKKQVSVVKSLSCRYVIN